MLIIDVETTGTEENIHSLVSIGAVDFLDPKRKIVIDSKHSIVESRYYCIGKVGGKIITVRFTYRRGQVRIFGAGYWRKGKMYYEEE